MWIVPQNLQSLLGLSAQDMEVSNSDSNESLASRCEQHFTWRSKPSQWRTWLARLKRVGWMQHLSGRILRPSMAGPFVRGYTSSLEVIPVSRSQLQARDREQTTPDTFGRILHESCRQLDLFGVSSRMSPDTLPLDTPQFTEAYEIWITQLRQESLQRQSAALHTRESGCLSWPTPQADTSTTVQHGKPALAAMANWRTPNGSDGEGGIMENLEGKDGHYKLRDQVNWLTPKVPSGGGCPRNTPGGGLRKLEDQTECGPLDQDSPSMNGKNRGQLNPAWVEQLMGLQVGWTDLDF